MRYFISPFLNSHSFHLIVGDARVGKTTYALQTAAMLLPTASRPVADVDGLVRAWGRFPYGPRLAPTETVWYVECFRPLRDVEEKCRSLGVPIASPTVDGVHIVTTHEVLEARPESSKAAPVNLLEVFDYIVALNDGQHPTILIVDGISGLLTTTRENQHHEEMKWFQAINRKYLKSGGTLIGVQTFTSSRRVPGVSAANATPGTFAFSGCTRTVSEIVRLGRSKNKNRRNVNITGSFDDKQIELEFLGSGNLAVSLNGDDPIERISPADIAKVSNDRAQQILDIAVQLSIKQSNGQFQSKDLVYECKDKLKLSESTIRRFIEESPIIRDGSIRGWKRLVQAQYVN